MRCKPLDLAIQQSKRKVIVLRQAAILRSMGADYVLVSADEDFDQKLSRLAHELNATLILDAIGGEFTQRLIDASLSDSLILLYANLSDLPAKITPNSLWLYNRRVEGFYLRYLGWKAEYTKNLEYISPGAKTGEPWN